MPFFSRPSQSRCGQSSGRQMDWDEFERQMGGGSGTRTVTRVTVVNGVKTVETYTENCGDSSSNEEDRFGELELEAGAAFEDNKSTSASAAPTGQKDYQKWVLNEHNKYRNRHQVGSLVLDEKLNNLAQEWANRLASTGSFQHRPNSGYGENISMGSGSYANDLVKPWYDEVQNYNFGRHAGSGTGHFTQIVWKASKKLGVGRAVAKDGSTYLVCNYEPAGNLIGAHAQNVFPAK